MEKIQKEITIPSIKELQKMSEVDIRTVDQESLIELEDVKINMNLPEKERVCDFIEQIKNPYCYKDHGMIVKIEFAGTRKFEECIEDYISTES